MLFILIDDGGAHCPPLLQRRQLCWLCHWLCHVCLHRCRCSPPPSPPPPLPPLQQVTLGDGACKWAHNLNRIGQGGGSIWSSKEKKVKNHGIVRRVTHDFYVKINPRQKSSNTVACASVAPMQLHCLILHKGINIWQIIAQQRKNEGGRSCYTIGIWAQLAVMSPVLGIIFRSAGKHPKKYFLKATARPQIQLWRKVMRNQKY